MPKIPVATYRLQLNKDFPLDRARALLPFLEKMGISHLYASPIFRARSGSPHGYDVVDPSVVNPELGGDEALTRLSEDLRDRGMGLMLDIVPNHMAASPENAWWMDVLESGSSSAYAGFFDVEWGPAQADEKILLPTLGSPYGTTLDKLEIHLEIGPDGFSVRYYSTCVPLAPTTYSTILKHRLDAALDVEEFHSLLEMIDRLPERTTTSWEGIEGRRRDIPQIKQRLWALYSSNAGVKEFIDRNIAEFNGREGDPGSLDLLDGLLARQSWRLAWWRIARERLNYRRFFDVSELIGMRMENEQAFAASHDAVLRWVREGKVQGLRIDHIDGLFQPREYLERLASRAEPRPYIVAEKILLGDETVPLDWPIEGTTGYDFLGILNGIFIDPAALELLHNTYAEFTGLKWTETEAAYEQKRWIMQHLFGGEMSALGLHLALIAEMDRYGRDMSPEELRAGLAEITACLPVYRTYIDDRAISDTDRACIEAAVAEARRRNPNRGEDAYVFLRRVLLLDFHPSLAEDARHEWRRFVMRWQQISGPIAAKGVEDTTYYLYNRLVSMNEVGGQPDAVPLERFHGFNALRRDRWPASMSATSTHDTKRSEDVRARINVLSEIPADWTRWLGRWRRWNRDKKPIVNGHAAPDPNEEILLYQTLLGAWPLDRGEEESFLGRLRQYVMKATREAKVYSTWLAPNEAHEQAIYSFIDAILDRAETNRFRSHFLEVQARVAFYGALNSLSQTLLKIAAPGVPDFYQNTFLWDFSLVDPDNRRPVDVESRLRILEGMDAWTRQDCAEELLANWKDGRVKVFVAYHALQLRQAFPQLFIEGEYVPVEVTGTHANHVIAFSRVLGGRRCMVVVPRFATRLSASERYPIGRRIWKDTRLLADLAGGCQNVLTGEWIDSAEVATVLSIFPLALLTSEV